MKRLLHLLTALLLATPAVAAPPGNDDYLDFTTIPGALPQTANGTNVEATTEPGETLAVNMEATVWYRWTAPADGIVEMSTAGAGFDTMLAVFAATPGLPGIGDRLAMNDDEGGGVLTSRLTLSVIAGQTLAIQVGGFEGQTGAFPLQIAVAVTPHDHYAARRVITGLSSTVPLTNAGATTEPGEPLANASVQATVWAVWTAPASGSCTVDTTSGPVMDSFLVVYTDNGALPVATQELGRNNDAAAGTLGSEVTFSATAGQTYAFQVGGMGAARGAFNLRVTLTVPPPLNDNYSSPAFLPGVLPASVSGANFGATLQAGEHVVPVNTQATVWYVWTAPAADRYQIDTLAAASLDTTLAVYTGSGGGIPPFAAELVAANDDAGPGIRASRVFINTTAGQSYAIQVGGFNAARGNFTLSVSLALPPNDHYADRILLGSAAAITTSGWNVRGTLEPGESVPPSMQASVWYVWTAPFTGECVVDTIKPAPLDTILAVYEDNGALPAAAALIASNDDNLWPPSVASRVTFAAVAGSTYAFQIGGYNAARGDFPLNLQLTVLPPDIELTDATGAPLGFPQMVSLGLLPSAETFTLRNTGRGTLTDISASIIGPDAARFSLTTLPPATLGDSESATFIVTHTPAALETAYDATLRILSSDPDESPLDIPLLGYALDFNLDSDGDGLNNASEWQLRALGFRPFDAQPALVAALNAGANGAGFYRKEQLQGLHAGASFAERDPVSGNFALKLKLRKSADLSTYSDFPLTPAGTSLAPDGTLRFEFAPPDNAAFFKLEVE